MSYNPPDSSQKEAAAPRSPPASMPETAGGQISELSEDALLPDNDTPSLEKDTQAPKEVSADRDAQDLLSFEHAYISNDGDVPDPGDKSEDENADKSEPVNGQKDKAQEGAAAKQGLSRVGERLCLAWKANARRSSGELAASYVLRSPKKNRFENESAEARRQAAETDPLTQCWYYLDPLVSL